VTPFFDTNILVYAATSGEAADYASLIREVGRLAAHASRRAPLAPQHEVVATG
jgi:hypothetical protein